MRKSRFLVVAALIAVLGIAATAFAQTNAYDFTGKVPAGGTKAKPKITGFSFNYTITDPAGNLPQIVKAYKFTIGGAKVNTRAVTTTCTAAKINAATNDQGCSKKAIVGTGSISADIGQVGTPKSATCTLTLTAYAAGTNKVALFLDGTAPGACVAPISQAIDAKWANTSKGAALSFTVPNGLRHQLGLDVAVTSVKSTWKKLSRTIKGKKVGYFSSVGCKTKQRSASVTFTSEAGVVTPLTKNIGKC
ncbi:hypothetical protein FSW04_21960 [Baekduia soli]|uniref:Uncharacterized protein n=1 Tax=Baekduia soli TaxID=496014 RepID=A0A5B8UAB1_9ACTN|nr:hypothetical protein [Baekduia soli]QEC49967.1 hypothetical protein FSW04_21960 [Baekduia soli]